MTLDKKNAKLKLPFHLHTKPSELSLCRIPHHVITFGTMKKILRMKEP